MVCSRCKAIVRSELEKLGYHPVEASLGEAEIIEDLKGEQKDQFNQVCDNNNGFSNANNVS